MERASLSCARTRGGALSIRSVMCALIWSCRQEEGRVERWQVLGFRKHLQGVQAAAASGRPGSTAAWACLGLVISRRHAMSGYIDMAACPPSHYRGWQRARLQGHPSRAAPARGRRASFGVGRVAVQGSRAASMHCQSMAPHAPLLPVTPSTPCLSTATHPVVLDKVLEIDGCRLPHLQRHRLKRDELGKGGAGGQRSGTFAAQQQVEVPGNCYSSRCNQLGSRGGDNGLGQPQGGGWQPPPPLPGAAAAPSARAGHRWAAGWPASGTRWPP